MLSFSSQKCICSYSFVSCFSFIYYFCFVCCLFVHHPLHVGCCHLKKKKIALGKTCILCTICTVEPVEKEFDVVSYLDDGLSLQNILNKSPVPPDIRSVFA